MPFGEVTNETGRELEESEKTERSSCYETMHF